MTKIEVRIISELMGRPAEHVKETLQTLVTRIGAEKGIEILSKKYHEPKKVEGTASLFSAFAEMELSLESLEHLLQFIYAYAPSNVEIISPENLKIPNADLNMFFNNLLQRMHSNGAMLKQAVAERNILLNQIEFLRKELGDKVTDLLAQNQQKQIQKSVKKDKPAKKTAKKSAKKPEKSKK